MNLADLEKQIAEGQRELQKRSGKPAEAKPTTQEAAQQTFTLGPVFDYLDHLKKEPREILEARYAKVAGKQTPKEARHEWLVLNIAYDYQLRYYRLHGRAVPNYMMQRVMDIARSYPGAREGGRAFDADDPTDEVEIWDDTRVATAVPNPYAKGDARTAFHAVEMAGPAGIGFAELCKTFEVACDESVPHAQERALNFFTKYVREGLTRIIVQDDTEAMP